MVYKNQNFMTNRKIKKEVDKNQKDYIAPVEEPIIETGDINVNIKNEENEGIEGAIVTLTKENESYSGTTNETGECTILEVPLGTYDVLVTADEYIEETQQFTVETSNNNIIITLIQGPQITGPQLIVEEEGEI